MTLASSSAGNRTTLHLVSLKGQADPEDGDYCVGGLHEEWRWRRLILILLYYFHQDEMRKRVVKTLCRGKRRQEEGERSRRGWRQASCTTSRWWTPPAPGNVAKHGIKIRRRKGTTDNTIQNERGKCNRRKKVEPLKLWKKIKLPHWMECCTMQTLAIASPPIPDNSPASSTIIHDSPNVIINIIKIPCWWWWLRMTMTMTMMLAANLGKKRPRRRWEEANQPNTKDYSPCFSWIYNDYMMIFIDRAIIYNDNVMIIFIISIITRI